MTDKEKLEAIRAEIERLFEKAGESLGEYRNGAEHTLITLNNFIDSLPEEPVSNPLSDENMDKDRWQEAVKAACCDVNYRSHYGFTETRDDYFVDGVQWADEHPIKEPVSEALEEFADESSIDYRKMRDYQGLRDPVTLNEVEESNYNGIIAGAQWQKEQMMQGAVDATITDIRTYKEKNEVDFTIALEKGIIHYEVEQKVKVTIIKDE